MPSLLTEENGEVTTGADNRTFSALSSVRYQEPSVVSARPVATEVIMAGESPLLISKVRHSSSANFVRTSPSSPVSVPGESDIENGTYSYWATVRTPSLRVVSPSSRGL